MRRPAILNVRRAILNNIAFAEADIGKLAGIDRSFDIVDASGAYFLSPNNVGNGHPNDKLGWALAAGAKFNLQRGDMLGFNVCYSVGAAGKCTNEGAFQLYDALSTVGVGWLADGIFGNGTEVELTRVWSALAATSISGTRSGEPRGSAATSM
jgi:hypothetical protein